MAQEVRVRGLDRTQQRRIGYTGVGRGPAKIDSLPDVLDLDDGQTRKFLQGDRSRFVVLPDASFTLQKDAGLAVANPTLTGMVIRFYRAWTIERVIAQVGVAPAGAALILDVHKIAAGGAATAAGTTIFTTQSRRPTVADGATVSPYNHATSGVPEVTAVAAGDLLRVEIDQVGSGTAGSDLVVQIFGY